MEQKYDYCGKSCNNCKEFKNTELCDIRNCAKGRQLLNCACCIAFPCNLIKPIVEKYPEAGLNLNNYKGELVWRIWNIL